LSPSKAEAAAAAAQQQREETIDGDEKLQSLEDELAQLRAEIAGLMNAKPTSQPTTTTTTTATTTATHYGNGSGGGSGGLPVFAAHQPTPASFVPPPPPPPMPQRSAKPSKPMPLKQRSSSSRSSLDKENARRNDAPHTPSADALKQQRHSLRASQQRRSLGGTPHRTPPREREARRLASGDTCSSDQQSIIANALRRKFAALNDRPQQQQQQQEARTGVVSTRGRAF
jgi:hypothetical protein